MDVTRTAWILKGRTIVNACRAIYWRQMEQHAQVRRYYKDTELLKSSFCQGI